MRVIVVALLMLLAALVARPPAFGSIPVVKACSCPDCDSIRDSDVIVGGWILGWRESTVESPLPSSYIAIDLDFVVDKVFKGTSPAKPPLVDFASLWSLAGPPRPRTEGPLVWAGAGGACGAFDEDPTGKYAIFGFATPYAWQTNRMRVLYLGAEPASARYEEVVRSLSARLGTPAAPSAGNSPGAAPRAPSDDWMFLSLIGAGSLLLTIVLLLGWPKSERPADPTNKDPRRGPE